LLEFYINPAFWWSAEW